MIHYIIFDRTPMRISSLFNLFAFLIREHAYILHSEMHFEICHFMKNKLYTYTYDVRIMSIDT